MTMLRQLPDAVVDCVNLDPPYNLGVKYADHDDAMTPAAFLTWAAGWLGECARVLKPTGSLWVMMSEEFVSEVKVLAEGRFGLVYTGDAGGNVVIDRDGPGLWPRHHVIWYLTFGTNCERKLTRSHTHLLHFVRDRKKHKWNSDAVRVPSARQVVYGDKRANPDGRLPDDTWILRPQDPDAGFAPSDDVWHYSRICGTHKQKLETPNQIPEQLVARILRLTTDEGDLVCDCFSGSGTSAAVAKKLGRRFVACDITGPYVQQGLLRLSSIATGRCSSGTSRRSSATTSRR